MLPPLENNGGGSYGGGSGYVPPPTGQTGGGVPGIPSDKPTTGVPMNTYGAYSINWQDAESKSVWVTFFGAGSTEGITVEKLIAEGWKVQGEYLYPPEGEKGRLRLNIPQTTNPGSQTPGNGFTLAGMNPIIVIGLIGAAWYLFFRKGTA